MKESKIEVCRRIAKIGGVAISKIKFEQRKVQETLYYQNPRKCLKCNKVLYFDKRNNKFCDSKCSGSYNTKGRHHSDETKRKISLTSGHSCKWKGIKNPISQKDSKIHFSVCTYCNNIFITALSKGNGGRKTCSDKCRRLSIHNRSYLNGSRKTIYYLTEDKGLIIFESTWEEKIASLLDQLRIKWIRPKPIEWKDSTGKTHMYYSDFYLPDFNTYLDPKNPYCMKKDQEKMSEILKNYNVIYGDISVVYNYVNSLVNK